MSFLEKPETSSGPIRVQADYIAYDRTEDSYVAEGKVEVWEGNRKLAADRVFLNARTNEAEAIGNAILVQGEDVLRGERMKINLETSLGIIIQGSLFLKKQNFYLRGEEIERVGEDTYRVRGGSFTTCEGDWPAWRFTGRETLVTLEEYASVWGATFQVKNIPLFYSPYLIFPVKTKRQSGFLIPRIGYSNTGGIELDNAYFWAIAKNMDATFYLDLATIRGVGEGVEYRYVRQRESKGIFSGYHIRETEQYRQKRTEQLDRKPDRWNLDLQHEEYFSQTFFAKT
ncbi:MAG: putative LPS assembly protein LptD, partial [Deltaproteobacteria bacterium]|nr:putative LPS assembly protein LptD [Deltaproteobacteria bacterium]